MAWTYNAAALATSARDRVRFFIGDVDSTRQQLQDEEIDYILTQEPYTTSAAAVCCDALAAKYAFLVNTENSELRVSAAARHKHYMDLAKRLRAGGAADVPGDPDVVLAGAYAGGTSVSSKQALDANLDNVEPQFRLGMDDNPDIGDWADYSSSTI